MFPIGFFAVALGLFLADCAIKGRNPITTVQEIIRHPEQARSVLRESSTPFKVSNSGMQQMLSGTGDLGNVNDPLIGAIIHTAEAQIGKPYKWAANGPNAFDCSGLVWYAYMVNGVPIPRTTTLMLASGTKVTRANLQPGDLVFPKPGHVFLYIGNGRTIEAEHAGTVVKYGTVYAFMTARRYV